METGKYVSRKRESDKDEMGRGCLLVILLSIFVFDFRGLVGHIMDLCRSFSFSWMTTVLILKSLLVHCCW